MHTTKPEADRLYHQGFQQHQQGFLAEAEQLYDQARKIDDQHVLACCYLGAVKLAKGAAEEAFKLWDQALSLDPNSVEVLFNLGVGSATVNRLEDAFQYLDRALAISPDKEDVFVYKIQLMIQVGKRDEAESILDGLLNAPSVSANTFLLAAQIKNDKKDWSGAENVLNLLLEKIPDQTEALVNLGQLKFDQGMMVEARRYLSRAVTLFPNHFLANANYGKFLTDQEDAKGGVPYLERASQIMPNDWSIEVYKGNAYMQLGKIEQGIISFKKALKANPNDLGTRQNLSRALSRFVPPWHMKMLGDKERNKVFEEAIKKAVKKNSVVLDIGTGSGLLSLMAVRHGASKVYTCEQSPYIADVANEIIQKNGAEDQIKLFNKKSTDITTEEFDEIPDVVVAEIFDAGLVGEFAIPTFRHALKSLVKPGTKVIPARAEVKGRLIEIPSLASVNPMGDVEGFDLSPFDQFRPPMEYVSVDLDHHEHTFLSDEFDLFSFDFENLEAPISRQEHVAKSIEVTANQSGTIHGVAFWFNLWLDDEVQLSSRPGRLDNHWHQALFFFESGQREARSGGSIQLKAFRNDYSIWFED